VAIRPGRRPVPPLPPPAFGPFSSQKCWHASSIVPVVENILEMSTMVCPSPKRNSSGLALLTLLLTASAGCSLAARPSQLALPVPGTQPPASPGPAPAAEVAPPQPPSPPAPEAAVQTLIPPAPEPSSPAPAQASPPSPEAAASTPPPSAAATGSAPAGLPPGQCVLLPNFNARGDVISNLRGVPNTAGCCTRCQQQQGCNVFVHCPVSGGW
jgi:hypothetical protein